MLVNADLHIHSPYSVGTSRAMDLEQLYLVSVQKGIQVLGCGDALHPAWREQCRYFEDRDDFLLLPTAEVEDMHRIHHLILLPDFDTCADLASAFSPYSRNIPTSGRPHIDATGELIAKEVHHHGGLLGPAHAFTPWTSLFARFDHVRESYGQEAADFLELGLSADTSYAMGISDLTALPFLSNSDAHSASTVKIGREWNRLKVPRLETSAVLESVARGAIDYNAGFFPEVGKYNRTACSRCYRQYSLEEAVKNEWRCPEDGGRIKKGVFDRARELSTSTPDHRPPYYHRISLGEIIQQVLGTSSFTKGCRALYDRMITALGDEITILMKSPIEEIVPLDADVAESLQALRAGEIGIYPGGGGRYGTFFFKSKDYGIHPTTDHNAENS